MFTVQNSGHNQWVRPISLHRTEANIPVVYMCGVNENGQQIVTRVNLTDDTQETKILYTSYPKDDHDAPAILELPNGELLIGCAGHNDDNKTHYGVFADWDSVGLLPNALIWESKTTYTQFYQLGDYTIVLTRVYLYPSHWRLKYSTDNGATWSQEATVYQGDASLAYIIGTSVRRELDGGDEFIRLAVYHHPSAAENNQLKRTSIKVAAGGLYLGGGAEGIRYIDQIIVGTEQPFTFSDLPLTWIAPPNKSIRLWDVSPIDDYCVLVSMFDKAAPHNNSQYLLLDGASSANPIDLGVKPGEDLPHATYFPGGCFVRHGTPANKTMSIMLCSNPFNIDEKHTLYRVNYDNGLSATAAIGESANKLYRPNEIEGVEGVVLFDITAYPGFLEYQGNHMVYAENIANAPALQDTNETVNGTLNLTVGGKSGQVDFTINLE